jgi:hypothetical protein
MDGAFGGDVGLQSVGPASSISDVCATGCQSFAGGFEYSLTPVELKGVSAMACYSLERGTIGCGNARLTCTSRISLRYRGGTGIYQTTGSSTNGSFSIFARVTVGSGGCFRANSALQATFSYCNFVDNPSVATIAHTVAATTSVKRTLR